MPRLNNVYISSVVMRYDEGNPYFNAKNLAQRIAENLERFYRNVCRIDSESKYYDAQYAPAHKEAIERINEDIEAVILAYCHLTKEELDKLPETFQQGCGFEYNNHSALCYSIR